jgi:hypothetical protein
MESAYDFAWTRSKNLSTGCEFLQDELWIDSLNDDARYENMQDTKISVTKLCSSNCSSSHLNSKAKDLDGDGLRSKIDKRREQQNRDVSFVFVVESHDTTVGTNF